MSCLYLAVRIFLVGLHWLLSRRADAAAARSEAVTVEAERLIGCCPGPAAGRLDAARQQLKLSKVAAVQEAAENHALSCVAASDRVGAWRRGLANYAGRSWPYLAGKADAVAGLLLADHYGYGASWVLEQARRLLGQS